MRYLVIFIFVVTSSIAYEVPKIKNVVINEELKRYDNISFLDVNKKIVNLSDYKGNLVLLNFWATWCKPCKEEMPSLDNLRENPKLGNIKIFPINIGKDNIKKSEQFFKELNIKNLNIYFDNPRTLAKILGLRGVPTTILFNKEGEEFARVIGSINFQDEKFIGWIKNYN